MTTQARIHGGADAHGTAAFDFSTNSNGCGPCPAALAAVQAADASHYPDPNYTQLRLGLARFHDVEPERVVLAASASEFIFRFTAWTKQCGASAVCIPAAAYGDYAHAASAWGLQVVGQQADAQLVWACEPSSPMGQAHMHWPAWLQPAPAPNTPVFAAQHIVLDCAYAPLRLSGLPSLNTVQRDQVWQLFSPNKALALTGVRAAYAIAPAHALQAVEQLESMAPSWPIGAHGVALLQAWTQDATQAWLQRSLSTLRQWKAEQTTMLQTLGWKCLSSDANFFCAMPGTSLAVDTWLELLRGQGIKLRDAASLGLPGLVRISVQRPAAQQALLRAIGAIQATVEVTP
jgi:histidinol-phosphate aminotransferase